MSDEWLTGRIERGRGRDEDMLTMAFDTLETPEHALLGPAYTLIRDYTQLG